MKKPTRRCSPSGMNKIRKISEKTKFFAGLLVAGLWLLVTGGWILVIWLLLFEIYLLFVF